jgi:hypothetical protein
MTMFSEHVEERFDRVACHAFSRPELVRILERAMIQPNNPSTDSVYHWPSLSSLQR